MDSKLIYDKLRAMLGGKLPQAQFDAARKIIESSPDSMRNMAIALQVDTTMQNKQFSANGVAVLSDLEGLRLMAYRDVGGVWTIGIGTTTYPDGTKVKAGDVCTKAQAYEYVTHDVKLFSTAVNKLITVPLTQNQFDALVIFVYNIGATAFIQSSVDDKLNAGNVQGALTAWAAHNKVRKNGVLVVDKGLINRRNAEIRLFNAA